MPCASIKFMNQYQYIAIEGNIGAGKTTLSHLLAQKLNARLVLETFENNPFLPKFYENPRQYAFPLELFFLAERYKQLSGHTLNTDLFNPVTIADYYLNKSLIFASNNLEGDEYDLFRRMYDIMYTRLPRPDLLIYLYKDVNKLQEQIQQRGRAYEQQIEDRYLLEINDRYMTFFRQQQDIRIIILNTNEVDFKKDESSTSRVLRLFSKDWPLGMSHIDL